MLIRKYELKYTFRHSDGRYGVRDARDVVEKVDQTENKILKLQHEDE